MAFGDGGVQYKDVLFVHRTCLDLLMAAAYPNWLVAKVPFTAGKKHWGGWGFTVVAFGFPIYVSICGAESPVPLSKIDPWIEPAWLLMVALYACHWLATKLNWLPRHSRYIGKSYIQLLFPRTGLLVTSVFDLAVGYGLSLLIEPYSKTVAGFLLFSAFCGLITSALFVFRERRIIEETNDQVFEGLLQAERMKRINRF